MIHKDKLQETELSDQEQLPEEECPEEGAPSASEQEKKLAEEITQLKDQLLRTLAELENLRKRGEREKEDIARYAITPFSRDLLVVADNLGRALETIPPEDNDELPDFIKSLREGLEITERELLKVFEKHGIKKISPLGESFDHNYHQAMFEVETDAQPAGTVIQLLQPGYMLHERLLRPALVGVAKAKKIQETKEQ